ncbi:MAG TPA: HEAT repeat domain-containing protein [Planctomycetota bacterium]|nr:HEAT repeat domain-containing protein [Planctomycetota bacterium]
MNTLVVLLLILSPEAERLLLGESPFFRHEGMERAVAEGDVDLLKRAARSPLWDVRRLAAEGLGPRTPPELLKDPVAVVREAAVRALGTGAPEETLLLLLKDKDDAVRAEAVWAMRDAPSKRAVQPLRNDPSPTVATAALAVTGSFGPLRTAAARDDLGVAVPALAALGRAGGPGDAAFLLGRLRAALKRAAKEGAPLYLRDEPTADVALARALGEMARRGVASGGGTVVDEAKKLVASSDLHAPGALLLAELAAGARDVDAAARILTAQMEARKRSKLPNVELDPGVLGILHAFAREPWPELAPMLMPLLAAKSPDVRVAVAEALAGDAAKAALEDGAPDVRAVACRRIRDPATLAPLAKDPAARVRAACARALGRSGDPAAGPALAPLVNDPDAGVRRSAVGALLRTALPGRTEMLLLVALQDPDPAVRGAAGAAIEFLGEEETAMPRAIEALAAEADETRGHAIELIERLTEARFPFDPSDPAKGQALWKAWWDARAERAPKAGAFRYHVEDLRRKGIDLVLVMDATGSMSPVIQSTKRRIEAVVDGLREIVPDLRARIVAFRDEGDAFVTIGSPLTHDARILEDFLACVPAWGGGDTEEAVLAGLRDAVGKTPWREGTQRIVVLFGDAAPHDREIPLVEAVCKEFKGVIHAADVGTYGTEEGGAGGGAARAPIGAFVEIAAWGRGEAVVLTDEMALLRSLLVFTLGPAHRAAVETLFGL